MKVKTKKGIVVKSKKGKKLGGPYPSESEADERIRQVEYFKGKDKGKRKRKK